MRKNFGFFNSQNSKQNYESSFCLKKSDSYALSFRRGIPYAQYA